MDRFEIGERIRIERQKKGISQEAMAFHLDITQGAYSRIERGITDITIDRLYLIADILEISVFDLLPKSKHSTGINVFGLKAVWHRVKRFFGKKR